MERAQGWYLGAAICPICCKEVKDYLEDVEELGNKQGEDYGTKEGFIPVLLRVYSTKGASDGDRIIC